MLTHITPRGISALPGPVVKLFQLDSLQWQSPSDGIGSRKGRGPACGEDRQVVTVTVLMLQVSALGLLL